MINRYSFDDVYYEDECIKKDNGDFVKYEDYEALKADRDAQQKRANALAAENASMREAIEFATAPDMWIEQYDGMLDYRYSEWYVDVLNAAIETPATDAALAAIEARGVEKFIVWSTASSGFDYDLTIEDAKKFANELRDGRA